jgi:hypothetical protein
MSARNFYIMQGAVSPMQSELPCYTPLTNHATDVHTVPLVFASDYDTLRTELERIEQELCETEARALKWYHQINAHVDLYRELREERDELRTANQRLEGEVKALREALGEAERYLSRNKMNLICSGSILHRQMQAALRGNGGDA